MMKKLYKIVASAAALATLVVTVPARSDEILVSAAASLTEALSEIGKSYSITHPGTVVRLNFGASGALQQQINQGAPVDVFAPASPKEMDALESAKRIELRSRLNFAGNRLVLIAPAKSAMQHWSDLRRNAVRRIAISNPDSVPSGRYAKETLVKRGLWSLVESKVILGENVRQTLTYVAGGNVDAGIVFATDAQVEKTRVKIVDWAISGSDHGAIVYPAAVVARSPNAAGARQFVSFLMTPAAQDILTRHGFARASGPVARKSSASTSGSKPPIHPNASRR